MRAALEFAVGAATADPSITPSCKVGSMPPLSLSAVSAGAICLREIVRMRNTAAPGYYGGSYTGAGYRGYAPGPVPGAMMHMPRPLLPRPRHSHNNRVGRHAARSFGGRQQRCVV